MSDYEPLLPTLWDPTQETTIAPADFQSPGPLYPNLPTAKRSLDRKYTKNNVFQQNLNSPVYNALKRYDELRVSQGKSPISAEKSAKMATAAQENRAVTPEPERGFLENIGNDLTTLVTSIPRLPGQLWTEAQRLPNITKEISEIQRTEQSPVGQLGKYLQLPGVNLIPGTYTASNVLTGNTDELIDHPLYTALDVLPYANKAAKATPVAKAAREAEILRAAEQSAKAGVPIAPRTPNPIKALATKKLVDGELQPNLVGRGINATTRTLGQTKPGQIVMDTWSPTAREGARIKARGDKDLRTSLMAGGEFADDPSAQFARDVNTISERYPEISANPDIRQKITRLATNPVEPVLDAAGRPVLNQFREPTFRPLKLEDAGLSDVELAYAYELRDLSQRSRILANVDEGLGAGEVAAREWNGSEELFHPTQAKRIDNINLSLERYRGRVQARENARQYLMNTFDREANAPTMIVGGIEVPNPTAALELNNLIDAVKPIRARRGDLRHADAKMFLNSITRKRFTEARATLNRMQKSAGWRGIVDEQTMAKAGEQLDNVIGMHGVYEKYKNYTPTRLAQREKTVAKYVNRITPARFGEVEQGLAKTFMGEKVRKIAADDPTFAPQLAAYLDYVDQGNYASLIDEGVITNKDYISINAEVKNTIAELKAQGADPVFLHRVSPKAAKALIFPKILENVKTPSSLQARQLDVGSYVPDLEVALSHQAMEFLQRRMTEETIGRYAEAYGRPLIELRRDYLADAQAAWRADPTLNVNDFINTRLERDGWVKFDPDSMRPWAKRTTGATLEATDSIMIPATIKRNIDRMMDPPKLIAAIDPVMNAFRTSVLALSVRWLTNNVIGGAMLLGSELNLRDLPNLYRYAKQTRSMMKDGTLHNIPGFPEGVADISPEDITRITNKTSAADKVQAIHSTAAGKWIRELWDNAQVQKVKGAGQTVVGKSYSLNQWFDDFYRGIAYMSGEDAGLVKGLSKVEAERAGIATARKIMQNWDEITPIERTVLRYVFPFYGFMQHVARFVMRYPFDHPWRTAVLGSFARNELEDMGTGLPQRFLSMVMVGDQDEMGNQGAVTFGSANPFGAVADMYTLGGLLGQTNPLIASFAESMGLDPMTGSASLYPDMQYNPETGKLEAKQRNYLQTLTANILPSYNAIDQVFFNNSEFKQMMKTNPAAAGRLIQSNMGLPVYYQSVNVPTEIMKAEGNRIEAQDRAKGEMLRTGNYGIADQYPGLQGYLATLAEKQKEMGGKGLDEFKVGQEEGNVLVDNPVRALKALYTGQVSLPPIDFQSPRP